MIPQKEFRSQRTDLYGVVWYKERIPREQNPMPMVGNPRSGREKQLGPHHYLLPAVDCAIGMAHPKEERGI